MITICFLYYRSLKLVNLEAALFALRRQAFDKVRDLIVFDNNTDDAVEDIRRLVDSFEFPVPVNLISIKHGDITRTHAWSTNTAVRHATAPWIFFTRADYLLEFDTLDEFVAAATSENRFIVCGYYSVWHTIDVCDTLPWRTQGPSVFLQAPHFGREYFHMKIDSGVWMTTREIFDRIGGLNEAITAHGHAQTLFQYQVFHAGIEVVKIPRVLFYHPTHDYELPRDLELSHQQLRGLGVDIKELWARYDGPDNPRY